MQSIDHVPLGLSKRWLASSSTSVHLLLALYHLLSLDSYDLLTASWTGYEVNQTFGTSEGGAGVGHGRSEWEYAPASKYFGVRPSEYAWMSAWSRDNAWRQFVTLYLVTMYV